MKVVDILNFASGICATMTNNNIKPSDYIYVEMYSEYMRMRSEGHKYEYIVYYLSNQYNVSEASVYRIVKRLDKELDL